ncbi:hypothetical protein LZ30DRAFT_699360 [Colletotrichum cereale]|nr:hypothetical protein LZ30DRAFT_699360 [Colletotrichum cereale]
MHVVGFFRWPVPSWASCTCVNGLRSDSLGRLGLSISFSPGAEIYTTNNGGMTRRLEHLNLPNRDGWMRRGMS